MKKDSWTGKWIAECIDDELCIGQIKASISDEFDNVEYRDFLLSPVIVWIPNSDDTDRVGGVLVLDEEGPLEYIAFSKEFVVADRPSDHEIVKMVLRFNQNKI